MEFVLLQKTFFFQKKTKTTTIILRDDLIVLRVLTRKITNRKIKVKIRVINHSINLNKIFICLNN